MPAHDVERVATRLSAEILGELVQEYDGSELALAMIPRQHRRKTHSDNSCNDDPNRER
jgi:hypothetical protein